MRMADRRGRLRAVAVVVVLAMVAGLAALLVTQALSGDDGSPRSGKTVAPADPLDASAYDIELTPGTTPSESAEPAADIGPMLVASDAALKGYAGQRVSAKSVGVLRRIGPSAIWVGTSAADRVLVLLVSTEHPFAMDAGAKVTFTGAGATASPNLGKELGLTGEELADFQRQGTYLEVTEYAEG